MAKQGPPDKNLNFSLAVTYTKRSAPPNTDDDGEFEAVQVTQKQVTNNYTLCVHFGEEGS